MFGERFTFIIPDELPDLTEIEDDEARREEIATLFGQLRLHIKTTQTRRLEAERKYNVGINPIAELEARLDLLSTMFIGILSPERLRFELVWQKEMQTALERGIAGAQERMRQEKVSKTLHLPNGRSHKIAPKEENDGSSNGPE